jgi:hypothetical protein
MGVNARGDTNMDRETGLVIFDDAVSGLDGEHPLPAANTTNTYQAHKVELRTHKPGVRSASSSVPSLGAHTMSDHNMRTDLLSFDAAFDQLDLNGNRVRATFVDPYNVGRKVVTNTIGFRT